ncbi:hypothetical protein POTOM_055224 [Populus tomentosa]|uniref:Uncharacterized protein n=1 Tax=Populus tomentosa TaxID=118781 RepID=A0A8X7Y0R7_POPTO|nr:hypothetical protein POTOM_055224 [Populus tomentosa]
MKAFLIICILLATVAFSPFSTSTALELSHKDNSSYVHTGHLTLPRNKVARGSHHVARCIHRRHRCIHHVARGIHHVARSSHHLRRSHLPGHSNAHKWDCEIP